MFELILRVYKSCVELTPQWRFHLRLIHPVRMSAAALTAAPLDPAGSVAGDSASAPQTNLQQSITLSCAFSLEDQAL